MLEIDNLTCCYGKVEALKRVSLRVSQGELVTLIGANGAGKTTALKAISGLLPATGGRVMFEGEDITHASPRGILARGIAHCPEGRHVFPEMSVQENLDMGCYLRKDAAGIARDLALVLENFPVLAQRRRQPAGTLSGGEQQMLAIGRAFMSSPKLILFDEPSLGLAPNIVEHTFGIIKDLRDKGMTVLMVEQNAYAALEMCDRAYLLESGALTLEGTGDELINNAHVRKAYLGG